MFLHMTSSLDMDDGGPEAPRPLLPARGPRRRLDRAALDVVPGVFPVGDPALVPPDALEAVAREEVIGANARRAADMRAVDDDLLAAVELVQRLRQALEVARGRDSLGGEVVGRQRHDELERLAACQLPVQFL